jgi:hypothetical protein
MYRKLDWSRKGECEAKDVAVFMHKKSHLSDGHSGVSNPAILNFTVIK